MTKTTGIDIRKALLAAGMNPKRFDLNKMIEFCNANSIEDWEIESQVILGEYADGEKVINQFRI